MGFFSFLKDVYKRVGRKPILYVRVLKNELDILHIESGRRINRKAIHPYSNDQVLISNRSEAEEFYKEAIRELLHTNNARFEQGLKVVLQPMASNTNEISDLDKRIYQDFAYNIGARKFFLCEHQRRLSDEEVLDYWEKNK